MDNSNKNLLYLQEISNEEKTLKSKVFNFFYFMINGKNKTSLFTLYFCHSLEIIQIISFAFYRPHLRAWKIDDNKILIISIIISGFRLGPLLQFVSLNIFELIFFIFVALTFAISLLLIIQILFIDNNSKIFHRFLSFTYLLMEPLTIFFYIPITELFLLPLKCNNNKIFIGNDGFQCWKGIHLIYVILGTLSAICLFIYLLFINFFCFYPFQMKSSTLKISSLFDISFLIIKLLYEFKIMIVKNRYLSVAILLIFSIVLLYKEAKEPIYNIASLELLLNIRNIIIFWTFFILLVAELCFETNINGLIYLLLCGYPVIIFSYIMFFNLNNTKFSYNSYSFKNIDSCLSKTKFLVKIITTFIDDYKSNEKYNEASNQRNDILLKGFIKLHTQNCLKEECPLTKFIKNKGNFNIQKQSLLNYMTIYFNAAIKKFPNNKLLKLYYIQFSYDNKYNLNSIKLILEEIKKMKSDLTEEYIIYTVEKEIIKMKLKEIKEGTEAEEESLIIEQNYKRLRKYIFDITKLYVEFWGIFANNITNNLNSLKLYKLGEKLNFYLKEINHLWEDNLKNKKIESENENNAVLYSKFLREVIWDQKKSEIIQKKINEEHNADGFRKLDEAKSHLDNFESLLDSQDFVIFVNSNERGKCNIMQFSNSLINLIGYQKQEIINKPLEILMPSIFVDGHDKVVEEYIKMTHLQKKPENESSYGNDKKKTFILIKNKIGYLVPFNSKYSIFNNNDFSNSFLIKANLEVADTKSIYAYYILAKPDFSIESISSSSIHLGFTLDLLKKYIIKLNILVRTSKDQKLNLFEKYNDYLEEPKKVTWVYPNIIYPKNDKMKKDNKDIEDLIKVSKKKIINLQIIEKKYKEGEIIGFVFKFIELRNKKDKNEISHEGFIPNYKNEINFDLLNLNYIRTTIVKEKTGMRNLREADDIQNNNQDISKHESFNKKRKKKKIDEEESYEEEIEEFKLTKDKIIELQSRNWKGIEEFIKILPFYGNEISLLKHRPNGEQYSSGKAQEPLIKISLSNFIKRISVRLKDKPSLYKKIKNIQNNTSNENERNNDEATKKNYIISQQNEINNNNEIEEINRDASGDTSFTLMNILNIRSTKIIKFVDYIIYGFINISFIFEFALSYLFLIDNKKRFQYLSYSYDLFNNLVYTKYAITEGVLATSLPNYINFIDIGKDEFISNLKIDLERQRKEFTEIFSNYNNPSFKFPNEYTNYTSNTNVTLNTINNGIQTLEEQPFFSAINKLTTSIFYISTMSNQEKFDMSNKYIYELMVNILNGYYKSFEKIILILLDDFISNTKKSLLKNIIIFVVTLFICCLYLILYWKMMTKLDNDREKSINLFLSIKKKVFEDLKTSSENFSNKLLNNFCGTEESEEESQHYYKSNVKSDDINAAKFKALNEYKATKNKKGSFFFYFLQLLVFFIICNIFLLFKFYYSYIYYDNISKFIKVYNSTQFSQIYLMSRINMIKQYLYNDSLPVFNFYDEDINNIFKTAFFTMSDQFEQALKTTSKTKSFLRNEYTKLFKNYVYENFTEIIEEDLIETNSMKYREILSDILAFDVGFKYICLDSFEVLRFLSIKYLMNNKRNKTIGNISELLNDFKWKSLHEMLIHLIRPCYKSINKLINKLFFSYVDGVMVVEISIFIIIIGLVTLNFWIIWKKNENQYIDLIKKSLELINLIPEEIKNIIVSKLNESN